MATQAEILRMSSFCRTADLGQVGAQDVREQPVVGLDVVDDPQQVVGDVAEERLAPPRARAGRRRSESRRAGSISGRAARRNSSTSRLSV